jgi:hypothetical protein
VPPPSGLIEPAAARAAVEHAAAALRSAEAANEAGRATDAEVARAWRGLQSARRRCLEGLPPGATPPEPLPAPPPSLASNWRRWLNRLGLLDWQALP